MRALEIPMPAHVGIARIGTTGVEITPAMARELTAGMDVRTETTEGEAVCLTPANEERRC